MSEIVDHFINEGRVEGRIEGREDAERKFVTNLKMRGFHDKEIAELADVDIETVREWTGTIQRDAQNGL